MKRKIFFISIFFFFFSTFTSAWGNPYEGVDSYAWVDPYGRGMARASYLGTTKTVNVQFVISEFRTKGVLNRYRPVAKMTKLEKSFLQQALSKYDLELGEISLLSN